VQVKEVMVQFKLTSRHWKKVQKTPPPTKKTTKILLQNTPYYSAQNLTCMIPIYNILVSIRAKSCEKWRSIT